MKSIVLSAFFIFSVNAIAAPSLLKQIDALPDLIDAKVVSKGGGGIAAVQPIGLVVFKYRACGPLNFAAKVSQAGATVTLIQIVQASSPKYECRQWQEFEGSVQFSSDVNSFGRFVVLNPELPVVE